MHALTWRGQLFCCYNPGGMKRLRHNAILDIIRSGTIASQEELMHGLKARRIEVSQSTLSRDIQELRLAKTGGVYTVVESEPVSKPSDESFRRIIREFLVDIAVAKNIVVVKTGPGHASTVSQAIDETGWPEAIGTIAGENTVFIAARSEKEGKKLERRLRELL
ncbi:MAG: ArgR family transcriptional regulator [Acidobacteria bacterium]|nr:MAG: ArgR family transcriptional regulator [Acidobacteriota bacterium]